MYCIVDKTSHPLMGCPPLAIVLPCSCFDTHVLADPVLTLNNPLFKGTTSARTFATIFPCLVQIHEARHDTIHLLVVVTATSVNGCA